MAFLFCKGRPWQQQSVATKEGFDESGSLIFNNNYLINNLCLYKVNFITTL